MGVGRALVPTRRNQWRATGQRRLGAIDSA
jgi:hypothetical protein